MILSSIAVAVLAGAASQADQPAGCTAEAVGCYSVTDPTTGKSSLPTGPGIMPSITWEWCAWRCAKLGFGPGSYMGMRLGSNCYCGTEAPSDAAKGNDTLCNLPCVGNPSQPCGGPNHMKVLKIGGADCGAHKYPTLHGCIEEEAKALPYCNTSLPFDQRLASLVSAMTREELITIIAPNTTLGGACDGFMSGVPRLGLPWYAWLVETNVNIQQQCIAQDRCATSFVNNMAHAAAFNRTSWLLKGRVISTEMRAYQNVRGTRMGGQHPIMTTGFGPNMNIMRDPRFGRSSEIPGEDPYLNGAFGTEMVKGMQEKDSKGYRRVNAYLKHFTAYSEEHHRLTATYNISQRDFFESYLPHFEMAMKEGGAAGVMCSYNGENGHPSCANGWLLNEVLRNKWNRSDAHVVSDCGAVSDLNWAPVHAPTQADTGVFALNNGTDLELGSTRYWLVLNDSRVTDSRLREAVKRTLGPQFLSGRFDPVDLVSWTNLGVEAINSTEHQEIAYDAALQSVVLLKNDNKTLPLRPGLKVAVIGPMGDTRNGLKSDYAKQNLCWGGGGKCIPTIFEAVAAENVKGTTRFEMGTPVNNATNVSGIDAAVALAAASDFVILAVGDDLSVETETLDRNDTALPGAQPELVSRVLRTGTPAMMAIVSGGPMAIDPFVADLKAAATLFRPNVHGTTAFAQSVFGKHNRWGKLPITMYPHSYVKEQSMDNYDMSVTPGRTYKYYTGKPLFPFGFGLSYSTFSMDCSIQNGEQPHCTVRNVAGPDGDEVVLLYISPSDAVRNSLGFTTARRTLVDFARVAVPAGSSADISFSTLTSETFGIVNLQGVKTVYPGQYNLIFSRGHGDEVVVPVTLPLQ